MRPLVPKDWAAVLALDLRAFGASRERLLRNLAARTHDPVASTSLDLTAEALDQHARKLEEMALRCAAPTASFG